MTHISHDRFDLLYRETLQAILDQGEDVAPRGQNTKELRGVTLELERPWCNLLRSPARKLNHSFSVAEWLWIQLGYNDVKMIAPYNGQISGFSDDGERYFGAYGPRVIEQLPYVKQTLKSDPSSRQAIVDIWRERPRATRDVPCTLNWQFFVRGNALEMHAHMRSNDAFLGLPYDLFNFTMVQQLLARELNLVPGRYYHHVGSLHLYEPHWGKAEEIYAEYPQAEALHPLESPYIETPLPPAMVSAFVELTLLRRSMSDPQSLRDWLTLQASRLPTPWDQYLLVLGAKFYKTKDLPLSDPYLTLLYREQLPV